MLSEPKSELLKKISYQNIPSFDLDPDLDQDPFFSSVNPDLHPNVMDPNLYNLGKRFFCNFGSDQINQLITLIRLYQEKENFLQ